MAPNLRNGIVRRKSREGDYAAFLEEVKEKTYQSRADASRSVIRSMTDLFWQIGQGIAERERRLDWKKIDVARLSSDLMHAFGGKLVFSMENLWNMRQFYRSYRISPDLQESLGEIPWSHHVQIMAKAKSP